VLDESRWLKYISELLKVSCEVCVALHEERSSVMVCYEAGWDRTTQVWYKLPTVYCFDHFCCRLYH